MSTQAKVILTAEDRTRAAFESATGGLDRFASSAGLAQKAMSTLAAGLSVAAVTNYVRNLAATGQEVQRLSALVNTSAERFQAEAYAAQTAGISQEKYADILKDVQDKVGDFLQTGGGPLKDFFEQIAPRVGVTAEQFRKLSGPEALQLYVSSLQKANISQNEMTFFMEAIASDSTLLLPLLRDNGKAMNDLAKEARDLGVVLDEKAIKAAKDFNAELVRLSATAKGFGYTVAGPIISGLNEVIGQFRLAREFSGSFYESLFRTGTSNAPERIGDLKEKIAGLNKELAGTKLVGLPLARLQDSIASAGKDLAMLQEFQRRQSAAPVYDFKSTAGGGRGSAQDPRLLGIPAAEETAGYRPPKSPKLGGSRAGLTEAQKAEKQYQDDLLQYEKDQDAYRQRMFTKRLDEQAATEKQYQDGLLQYERDLDDYKQRMFAKRLEEEEKLQLDAAARVKKAAEDAAAAQQRQADRLGDAFAATFDRLFTDGMKFGDLLKKLAFDAINIQLLTPATQKIGSALGSAVSSLFSFDGGGYTGSGSRSGGMDGKGGFMAMLHPNETVLDHTKGQGMGGTTIVQNVTIDARGADAGVEQRIRVAMAQTKAETLAAVRSSVNRGGSWAQTMGRA